MGHWALADLPQGWFNHGERALALIEQYRPVVCVELGTWRGASAIATARVVRRWGGRLTCIDTWAAGPVGPPTMLTECEANLAAAAVANVDLVVSRSVEAAAQWAGGSIDYLYVDADHSEQSVTDDLAAWWPHVRVGGLVAGDDYGDPVYPGVTTAWDKFERAGHPLRREGLVWAMKERDDTYIPVIEVSRTGVICADCGRIVYDTDVDGDGRCCFCALPPVQRGPAAESSATLPRQRPSPTEEDD